ncbi:MAG TPA: choice-of-anchor tandem repeat NxxGxxAF-containing protein [Verrucomicrobiae bacterium]|jgi:hypothetical protein|nr:choice-of-anchor tandem repeat NxxGxxAF-containing protein [Verrucomicrobiae bacterium]
MKLLSQISSQVLLGFVLTTSLPANTAPLLVAADGDLIANGIALKVSGSPAIGGVGCVAFRAVLSGKAVTEKNRIAIVAYSNGVPTIVVRTGDVDPITGAVFNQLSDPILSSTGILVFLGSLKPGTGDATKTNSTGIWKYQKGKLGLIIRAGAQVPDFEAPSTSFLVNFNQIAVNDWGGVVFTSSIERSGSKHIRALFASHFSGGLFLSEFIGEEFTFYGYGGWVAGLGVLKPLPHVCGQGRTLVENGDYIFSPKMRAFSSDPSNPYDAGVLRPFHFGLFFQKDDSADESGAGIPGGPPPPSYTAQFKLHEAIINNSNQVVVRAIVVDQGYGPTNNTVIATVFNSVLNSSFQFLVRTGDAAPDVFGRTGDATYSELGDPILNNNGHIAFLAHVHGPRHSNTLGVWSDADGIMKRIVAVGDIEPGGSGAKFQDFDQIVLPDVGGVIIEADVGGSGVRKQGLWAVGENGALQRLLLEGDTLDFHGSPKTLKRFRIFQIPSHFAGQTRSFDPGTRSLIFQAIFSDGSWGIYRISP